MSAYSPIPDGYKGRVRWDALAQLWRWIETGPYLKVTTLKSGAFRVARVWK